MRTDIVKGVSATAFLVNESRARRQDVSRDPFCRRWVPAEDRPEVVRLWEDYAARVYPHDGLAVSVRHRYFLDLLERYAGRNDGLVFVNLGCGFTSYPFLVDPRVACVEADLPHVVAARRARMARLQADGLLPDREVTLVGADLGTAEGRAALRRALPADLAERPSYVQLEGLSYYLARPAFLAVLRLIRAVQAPGSGLAFDLWEPAFERHAVFRRQQRFFEERLGYPPTDYHLQSEADVHAIPGYEVVELTGAVAQEPRFAGTCELAADLGNVIPERYAHLERRGGDPDER